MELSEQELVRRQSLQTMRDLGIDPYPAAEYVVTGYSTDIKANFVDEANGERTNGECTKVLREGQLYLMYKGTMYNVLGQTQF